MKRGKYKTKKKKIPVEVKKRIVRQYQKGFSIGVMQVLQGMSKVRIYEVLKGAKIKLRSKNKTK